MVRLGCQTGQAYSMTFCAEQCNKLVAENCVRGHAYCHTFEDRATCDANSEVSTYYEIDQYHYQS